MKFYVLPETAPGKWAVGLCAAFVVLMVLKFTNYFHLPLPSPLIALFALAGFVLGIRALVKKERALAVMAAVGVGALVLLWVAAEIAFPH